MTDRRHSPFLLDPGGRALHTESAALRARGAVTKVLLPGGVEAWSVNSHAAPEHPLTDPRVSKDSQRHWPRFASGGITPQWPQYAWVAVRNMFTAYGDDPAMTLAEEPGALEPVTSFISNGHARLPVTLTRAARRRAARGRPAAGRGPC